MTNSVWTTYFGIYTAPTETVAGTIELAEFEGLFIGFDEPSEVRTAIGDGLHVWLSDGATLPAPHSAREFFAGVNDVDQVIEITISDRGDVGERIILYPTPFSMEEL